MAGSFLVSAGFFSLVSAGFFSLVSALVSPSTRADSSVVPATSSSTAVSSAGFSGSTTIVGEAMVATTKSLPWIVGDMFSGNFIEDILMLVPI